MMEHILDFLISNKIEFTGAILGLLEVYLRIRQNVWCWFFALCGTLMYMYIFYTSKLYGDMSLMIYYLIMTLYGWYRWLGNRLPGKKDSKKLELSIMNKREWLIVIFIGVILNYAGWMILDYTDDTLPFWDSFTTIWAIIGTWMMAEKKLENWLIWIIVDFVSVWMYFYKDLYFTMILYGIYTVMAVIGYIEWRQKIYPNNYNTI